jgi:hypothetical protein
MTHVQIARIRALTLVCTLAATAAAHAETPQTPQTSPTGQTVHWARIGNECRNALPETDSVSLFGCGALGAFVVADEPVSDIFQPSCHLSGGAEEPAPYRRLPPDPLPSPKGWTPCEGGSCFRSPGDSTEPWVAVLDWDDGHGWSVGELVLEASDRRVEVSLLDLLGVRARLPPLGSRATDLDVLAQLCSLAERAYTDPDDRPVAVNMSFGRVLDDDPQCLGPTSGTFACQVGTVLDHLYHDLDIVPIAAAGNHAEILFPAVLPPVLSAGALELASFVNQNGLVEPSMETPPEAEALVLGYGFELENPAAPDDRWPVPAGSSYASALTAGWIAGATNRSGDFRARGLDTSGRWHPVALREGYGLAFDGSLVLGSVLVGPSRMMRHAMGTEYRSACWISRPETRRTLALGPAVPALPALSVVDLASDSGPLPGSRPCIPCEGDTPPPPPPPDSYAATGDLLLDLQASSPLPDGMSLDDLWLRAGQGIYELVPMDGGYGDFLQRFAAGDLEQLVIAGIDNVAGPQDQVSLVLIVTAGDSPRVWDAIPIAVHNPRGDACEGPLSMERF